VLIVEDDATQREALAQYLGAKGYRAILAVDGQDALEHLALGAAPCVILLDWMMPKVDGGMFLEARAASGPISSIPVFVMSASHPAPADLRIQGFLPKPFDLSALLRMFRAVCQESCPTSLQHGCPRPRS